MYYIRIRSLFFSLPLLFYLALFVSSPFYTPPLLRSPSSATLLEKATDVFLFAYYYHQGLILEIIKGRERAEQAFAKAGRYQPEFLPRFFGVDPHHDLEIAHLYEKFKYYDLAEHSYLSWLANHPADIAAHEQVRNLWVQTENWSGVIQATRQLLSFKPEDPYEYYHLGTGYLPTRQWDPAITAFEKSLRLLPDFADAYVQLGKIWEARGDAPKAQDFYLQAVERFPSPMKEELSKKNIKTIRWISLISLIPVAGRFEAQTHQLLVLPWNVKFKTPVLDSGKYFLLLSAKGSQAEGVFARLKLYNNEKLMETVYLDENFKIYRFSIENREKFNISFEFDNDGGAPQTGGDRKVWINGMYLEEQNG